jgi:hypothetical protein
MRLQWAHSERAILGRLRLRDRRPGKERTAFLELPA